MSRRRGGLGQGHALGRPDLKSSVHLLLDHDTISASATVLADRLIKKGSQRDARHPTVRIRVDFDSTRSRASVVPASMFANLFAAAYRHIDVLVYAAVFLHEAYPRLNDLLVERAEAGCAIRIAVGDADSANVQQRGREEKFGHGIESRCRLALMHYQALHATPGIELRTHATTLYNSIYRADDEMVVNAHVWA
ncbi:hypothetical protein [Nocardia farcinica]